jgi:hypothetical protein
MPSAEVDATAAHVGWGALFAFAGSTIWNPWAGLAILLGFASAKEFVFDIIVERDTWVDSAGDFLGYLVGGIIGYAMFFGSR